jgi:hypothetical protein
MAMSLNETALTVTLLSAIAVVGNTKASENTGKASATSRIGANVRRIVRALFMLTENMACLSEPTAALKKKRTTNHLNTIEGIEFDPLVGRVKVAPLYFT